MKIRPLSKPLQEKAEKELNEVPGKIEEDLNSLRCWLSKQEHIIYQDDDQLLVNFLRGSKFSLQRAKEKLDAYYSFRTLAPEIAGNLDPFQPDVQNNLKLGMCIPLPLPQDNPAGARVFLMRYNNYDPDEITVTTMLKTGSIVLSTLFNTDDNFVVSGSIVIWDMKEVRFKTALQSTPDLLKKAIYGFEKAYPTRFKAIYVINVPKFFESIVNTLKLMFSEKIAKRLYIYSTNNIEKICETIPKSILPEEYGGDAGPHAVLAAEWKKVVDNRRELLLKERNYYTDESKRPEQQNFFGEVFGVEGSFKKLEID